MKYIFINLVFIISLNLTAIVPLTGDVLATLDVKDDNFLVYYKNSETKKITLQTYSKDGKLIKTSPLESEPWQNFFYYNLSRRESCIYDGQFYTIKYPSSVAVIPEKEIRGMPYEEKENLVKNAKELVDLASFLPSNLKIENVTYIFVDRNILITTCWIKEGKTYDKYFLVFDLKKKVL